MDKKALNRSLLYLDSWLRYFVNLYDFPGAGIAIALDNKVIFDKAYGYADLDSQLPLTPNHLFRIASQSKTFTATSLMQLAEKEKLRLDDPIINYLPWLKDHRDQRWHNVTIRQLMNHSSGLIRDGEGDFWQLMEDWPDQEVLKAQIMSSDLVLDNNTKLKYSNFGYALLGLLIEAVSGMAYGDYVQSHILDPLKLNNTGSDFHQSILGSLATGYTKRDIPGKNRLPIDKSINTKALAPATGFYSTASDMVRYLSAQVVGSNKLLSDESKKEMQRVQWTVEHSDDWEAYGLGLDISYAGNRRVFGHGGGFPGFNSQTLIDPKTKLAVSAYNSCIDGLAATIVNAAFLIIGFYQENCLSPDKELFKFEGRYANLFAVYDFVATDKGLISQYPGDWRPFGTKDDLEKRDKNSFIIGETHSFSNEGEPITFKFNDQQLVERVNYAGETLWSEAKYNEMYSQMKSIKQLKRT